MELWEIGIVVLFCSAPVLIALGLYKLIARRDPLLQ